MSEYMDRYSTFWKTIIRIFKVSDDDRYGRSYITQMAAEYLNKLNEGRIVDIASGEGTDLDNIKSIYNRRFSYYALDAYPPNIKFLKEKGYNTFQMNIERDVLPFKDKSIDLIIANQILEHCKDLFWIFAEFQRVLKLGGCLIVGVPNLASSHNRLMLLLGKQPPCIETLGSHVRGFTFSDFKWFVENDGYFKVEYYKGSGRYTIFPFASRFLSKHFPNSSVGLFIKIIRTNKEKGCFYDVINRMGFGTDYYTGKTSMYENVDEDNPTLH